MHRRIMAAEGRRSPRSTRVPKFMALAVSAILLLAVGLPAGAIAAGSTPNSGGHGFQKAGASSTTQRHIGSLRTAAVAARSVSRPITAAPRLASPVKTRPSSNRAPAKTPHLAVPALPFVVSTTMFDGANQTDVSGVRPPDPWVAVNSSFVVQSVNFQIRVSNRSGVELARMPTWVLFGLPTAQTDADPHVLWDAMHGRWVAATTSYNFDFSDNFLNLAVSETSDPLGAWTVYAIEYFSTFPDFPDVASSSDKIIITANDFVNMDTVPAFSEATLEIIDWSAILGGTTVAPHQYTNPSLFSIRPAQILSPTGDLYLLGEDMTLGSEGDISYWRYTGNAASAIFADYHDLTTDPSIGYGPFTLPNDPRQPGSPATIVRAVDERPTDAIWRNGHLYWVNTSKVSLTAGATWEDAAWLSWINAAPGAVTAGDSFAIEGTEEGVDTYMPGVGLSGDGTVFVTYSRSSLGEYVSLRANRYTPVSGVGVPVTLAQSTTTYAWDRWGDFIGIAMDPVGNRSVWQTHEVVAADGTWKTVVSRLLVDADPPTTPGAPASSFVVGSTLNLRSGTSTWSLPIRSTWAASSDLGTGTVRYELSQSIDSGGPETPLMTSSTSATQSLLTGHTWQYSIDAVDALGNTSSAATGPILTPSVVVTPSVTYSSGWHSATSASYAGGSAKYSTTAGASATYKFSGARAVGFVSYKASTRGSVKIYLDGHYKGTVSLYSLTSRARQIAWQIGGLSTGTHTLKLVVVGTAHRPRVDVDAFVLLK